MSKKSDRWVETLTEMAPVGIFRTDAAGHCLYVNQRWCDIAGLSLVEAKGDGWARVIHPEDREEVVATWHDATVEGRPFRAEYRFLSPVGKMTWVIGEANTVYSEAGHLIGYVGSITDITANKSAEQALKQSEENLRSIITHMPVILNAFDSNGVLCAWNQQGERVSGYSASELVGNPKAMELLYPDTAYLQDDDEGVEGTGGRLCRLGVGFNREGRHSENRVLVKYLPALSHCRLGYLGNRS